MFSLLFEAIKRIKSKNHVKKYIIVQIYKNTRVFLIYKIKSINGMCSENIKRHDYANRLAKLVVKMRFKFSFHKICSVFIAILCQKISLRINE